MKQFTGAWIVIGLLVMGLLWRAPGLPVSARSIDGVNVPTSPIPEANDFATLAFKNGWDMSEFSDVSQYFNGAGRPPGVTLKNFQVNDGIFSATSTVSYSFFFPLFPGIMEFMQLGRNLGSLHPIDPNNYRCLYVAMKVSTPGGPNDGLRVLWYADSTLQPWGTSPNGGTLPVYTTPNVWQLYKVDLGSPPNGLIPGAVGWLNRSTWPGLQVSPTIYDNVNFEIDWVRLTSCGTSNPHQANITWTPDSSLNTVWVRASGSTHNIRMATGINGGSGAAELDTKGLPPGRYTIGLGTQSACCDQWSDNELEINALPIPEFIRPSPFSGEDYATTAGNSWDMGPDDIVKVDCSQWSITDGMLKLDTLYPSAVPSHCRGSEIGEVDSRIFLKMPGTLSVAGEYRYLSFRLYMNGEYAIPADGMMGRWMWTTTNWCTRVSHDIPYDVGWNTYIIDLYDPFNGTPVIANLPDCSLKHWTEAGQLIQIRFDPNENYTGTFVPPMIFHQELDWLRLTKVDQATKGHVFPIHISFNKPVEAIQSIDFYYTTDRSNPTQQPLTLYESNPSPPAGNHHVRLPMISNGRSDLLGGEVYFWDTSSVAAGEYFLCTKLDDGYNQSTFCSDAPVRVVNP